MAYNCDCISYNLGGEGGSNEVILVAPDFIDKDTICVDRCIQEAIQYLWAHKIPTLGCCCGHNERKPTVIVEKEFAVKTKYLLSLYGDDRDWDVLYWDLVTTEIAHIPLDK